MSSLFSGNLSSSHISAGWDASNFQAFRQPVKKAKRGALEKTPQGQALEHNSGLAGGVCCSQLGLEEGGQVGGNAGGEHDHAWYEFHIPEGSEAILAGVVTPFAVGGALAAIKYGVDTKKKQDGLVVLLKALENSQPPKGSPQRASSEALIEVVKRRIERTIFELKINSAVSAGSSGCLATGFWFSPLQWLGLFGLAGGSAANMVESRSERRECLEGIERADNAQRTSRYHNHFDDTSIRKEAFREKHDILTGNIRFMGSLTLGAIVSVVIDICESILTAGVSLIPGLNAFISTGPIVMGVVGTLYYNNIKNGKAHGLIFSHKVTRFIEEKAASGKLPTYEEIRENNIKAYERFKQLKDYRTLVYNNRGAEHWAAARREHAMKRYGQKMALGLSMGLSDWIRSLKDPMRDDIMRHNTGPIIENERVAILQRLGKGGENSSEEALSENFSKQTAYNKLNEILSIVEQVPNVSNSIRRKYLSRITEVDQSRGVYTNAPTNEDFIDREYLELKHRLLNEHFDSTTRLDCARKLITYIVKSEKNRLEKASEHLKSIQEIESRLDQDDLVHQHHEADQLRETLRYHEAQVNFLVGKNISLLRVGQLKRAIQSLNAINFDRSVEDQFLQVKEAFGASQFSSLTRLIAQGKFIQAAEKIVHDKDQYLFIEPCEGIQQGHLKLKNDFLKQAVPEGSSIVKPIVQNELESEAKRLYRAADHLENTEMRADREENDNETSKKFVDLVGSHNVLLDPEDLRGSGAAFRKINRALDQELRHQRKIDLKNSRTIATSYLPQLSTDPLIRLLGKGKDHEAARQIISNIVSNLFASPRHRKHIKGDLFNVVRELAHQFKDNETFCNALLNELYISIDHILMFTEITEAWSEVIDWSQISDAYEKISQLDSLKVDELATSKSSSQHSSVSNESTFAKLIKHPRVDSQSNNSPRTPESGVASMQSIPVKGRASAPLTARLQHSEPVPKPLSEPLCKHIGCKDCGTTVFAGGREYMKGLPSLDLRSQFQDQENRMKPSHDSKRPLLPLQCMPIQDSVPSSESDLCQSEPAKPSMHMRSCRDKGCRVCFSGIFVGNNEEGNLRTDPLLSYEPLEESDSEESSNSTLKAQREMPSNKLSSSSQLTEQRTLEEITSHSDRYQRVGDPETNSNSALLMSSKSENSLKYLMYADFSEFNVNNNQVRFNLNEASSGIEKDHTEEAVKIHLTIKDVRQTLEIERSANEKTLKQEIIVPSADDINNFHKRTTGRRLKIGKRQVLVELAYNKENNRFDIKTAPTKQYEGVMKVDKEVKSYTELFTPENSKIKTVLLNLNTDLSQKRGRL